MCIRDSSVSEWCVIPGKTWRVSGISRAGLLGGSYRLSRTKFRKHTLFGVGKDGKLGDSLPLTDTLIPAQGNGFRVVRNGPAEDVPYPERTGLQATK